MGFSLSSAQSVTISGDNAIISNDCGIEQWASNSCANPTLTPLAPLNNASALPEFPTAQNSGAVIGSTSVGAQSGIGQATLNSVRSTSQRLYLGFERGANGSLTLENGAAWTTSQAAVVGLNGQGTLNVTGVGVGANGTQQRSQFQARSNDLIVGLHALGTLNVSNGALVSGVPGVVLGRESDGVGVLNLSGFHTPSNLRSTVEAPTIYVGYRGRGTATIDNGALLDVTTLIIGGQRDSSGTMRVANSDGQTNQRTTVNAKGTSDSVFIGSNGDGVLNIVDGALVSTTGVTNIGWSRVATGSLNIDGTGSEFRSTNNVVIGDDGGATVNLTNAGSLTARAVTIANARTSNATLNIGGSEAAESRSGVIATPTITGGAGRATINFNQLDDIIFDPQLRGRLTVDKRQGSTTTLSANSDYTGSTNIDAGTWRAGVENAFSQNSDYAVRGGANLDLNGLNQTIGSLTNRGNVNFGGRGGTQLTVAGLYTGDNGTFFMNTVLGNDASVTDRLNFNRTTGNSFINVTNAGGKGAPTTNGIKIADVRDKSSDGQFSLINGDDEQNGQQLVVAGAFAYGLYQGSVATPDDGHWYLRSSLKAPTPVPPDEDGTSGGDTSGGDTSGGSTSGGDTSGGSTTQNDDVRYQSGVPNYEAYPKALLQLNRNGTLRQRAGGRFFAGHFGASTTVKDANAISVEKGDGFWLSAEGQNSKSRPAYSTSKTSFDQNSARVQIGYDGLLDETENGTWIGGIYGQFIHSKTKTKSAHGNGQIDVDGYGVGATLTYYETDGFYVDAHATATWYDSDLSSRSRPLSYKSGLDSFGYTLSVETGKSYQLDADWSLTPQAQLSYSDVNFSRFTDVFGSSVGLNKGDSLRGRLGLSLDYDTLWQDENGSNNKAQLYGIVNLYNEFLNGTQVEVSGVNFSNRDHRLWGGIGVGGTYSFNDEKLTLYGELLADTSFKDFGKSYDLKGNIGLRIKW